MPENLHPCVCSGSFAAQLAPDSRWGDQGASIAEHDAATLHAAARAAHEAAAMEAECSALETRRAEVVAAQQELEIQYRVGF